MAEISRIFNNPEYDASDIVEIWRRFLPRQDGVVVTDDTIDNVNRQLEVIVGTGLQTSIAAGEAFIRGYWYKNNQSLTKTASTAHATNPRIDRVVLKLDTLGKSITASIKTGAPASNPDPPSLTRTSEVYEISLARFTVAARAIAITNLVDERSDDDVCGLIDTGGVGSGTLYRNIYISDDPPTDGAWAVGDLWAEY